MTYALTITVDLPFPAALETTREALGASGFGVISDIDLLPAFSDKLGRAAASGLGDYRILGACNPHLARKALNSEPEVGLPLPCNVVVRRAPGATSTTVQAFDPTVISDLSGATAATEVATDATARLQAALDLICVPAHSGGRPGSAGQNDVSSARS